MSYDQTLTTTERAIADAIASEHDGTMTERAIGAEACDIAAALTRAGWKLVRFDPLEPLPVVAPSRGPRTSDRAAESISDMSERHRAVYDTAASKSEPWTYDELIYSYVVRRNMGHDYPKQEPQSIRSRAKELREVGWITKAGTGESDAGRPCSTWRVIR